MPGQVGVLLAPEDCEKILVKIDNSAKLVNYEISRVSDQVVGFLADHYYVTIEYTNHDNETCAQRFFLKIKPTANETQKNYIESMGIFRKEILNYKNFLWEFSQLASKPFLPKYYFSKNDDCLVLEDLASRDYQVCNLEYLDHGKCIGALNALARLHASSIVFEEMRSTNEKPFRLNEHYAAELVESTFSFREGHVRNMWCKTSTKCLEQLSKYFTDNDEVAIKVKQYIFSEYGLRKYLQPSKVYRNTVCHDDLWCNNMMFNEFNECMLLDFQLSRYSPPVFDVLLLLHLGTEASVLNKNLGYFVDLYYNFLTFELSRHNLCIEEIIPKSDFLASVDEYTLPALVEASLYGTNVYLPQNVSAVVTSSPEAFVQFAMKDRPHFVVKAFEYDQKFRDRFSTVLKPMFRRIEQIK